MPPPCKVSAYSHLALWLWPQRFFCAEIQLSQSSVQISEGHFLRSRLRFVGGLWQTKASVPLAAFHKDRKFGTSRG